MKHFNNNYTQVVGLDAQETCDDSAGCPGVVYVLELSEHLYLYDLLCSVMQTGDVCTSK